jgi:hypothetical protein
MTFIALQIAIVAGLGFSFFRWRKSVRKRNAQTWDWSGAHANSAISSSGKRA